jgi:hypothetical protein
MANPARPVSTRKARIAGLVLLAGLVLSHAGPALADDSRPSSDQMMRTLSGSYEPLRGPDGTILHGLSRPTRAPDPATRAASSPIVMANSVDAASLSRAMAAGNRMSQQLTTPEEDSAGTVGMTLLSIAGLVLAVVVINRLNRLRGE